MAGLGVILEIVNNGLDIVKKPLKSMIDPVRKIDREIIKLQNERAKLRAKYPQHAPNKVRDRVRDIESRISGLRDERLTELRSNQR